MPRRPRGLPVGIPHHVVKRAVRRSTIFYTPTDYLAFGKVLGEALQRVPLKLMAYCAMPNHWHLVVMPIQPGQLSMFMHWLTGTQARRWHAFHASNGTGPLYQDRFKSVPIQSERQFLWACRYVERNALRAGLVESAQDWRWSNLWQRCQGNEGPPLSAWPCQIPQDWLDYVNRPETDEEVEAIKALRGQDRRRGRPRCQVD